MIRSVPANAADSIYCSNLARAAVHGAMAGFTGARAAPCTCTRPRVHSLLTTQPPRLHGGQRRQPLRHDPRARRHGAATGAHQLHRPHVLPAVRGDGAAAAGPAARLQSVMSGWATGRAREAGRQGCGHVASNARGSVCRRSSIVRAGCGSKHMYCCRHDESAKHARTDKQARAHTRTHTHTHCARTGEQTLGATAAQSTALAFTAAIKAQ